tara:strand:+ start:565 stop:1449 length:885 start_codon:yes stop_codon:yes gene_type:complete
MDNLGKIVEELRKSKKFSRLGNDYIVSIIKRNIQLDKKVNDLIRKENYSNFKNSKPYKAFLKSTKKFLHDTYSVYQIKDVSKKEKLFKKMLKSKDRGDLLQLHLDILHCHSSSRERKNNYETIYRNIFAVCGKPKKILDVGCGINVFGLPFIGFRDFEYIGCDCVKEDLKLVDDYLNNMGPKFGFNGRSFFINIFAEDFLKKISKIKPDVCFLFKMTDMLDYGKKTHKKTEDFLKNVNSNFVVVSFPTKTVSNKKMSVPRRKWFELMCDRLKYSYDYFEIKNECFYIVNKFKKI